MPGGPSPPAEVIATWPAPNYVNPVRHNAALTVICCVFGSLSFLTVGARLWARFQIQHNPGLDDWLMIGALVPMSGLLVIVGIASQHFGFDRHIWDNPPSNLVIQRKLIFAADICYLLANCLIKCSILLFYRRLTIKSISPLFILATKIALASVIAFTITFHITLLVTCSPVSAFWDQADFTKLAKGYTFRCAHEFNYILVSFIISCVQDLIVTTLPLILFWRLRVPPVQKVALGAVFAVGYIVCAIAGVRIYYIYIVYNETYDTTWASWYLWIWMLLEILMGAMCTSAPTLKAFFHGYLGNANRLASGGMSRRRPTGVTTRERGERVGSGSGGSSAGGSPRAFRPPPNSFSWQGPKRWFVAPLRESYQLEPQRRPGSSANPNVPFVSPDLGKPPENHRLDNREVISK